MKWNIISRKCLAMGLALILLLSSFGTGVGIKGVEATEVWIEITDKAGLIAIKDNLSANYRLMADITLTGSWTPLGSSVTPFTGKLDGNGKVISGLTITNTVSTDQGLFSEIGVNGEVANLGIEEAVITAGDYSGILAGINKGNIKKSYVTGSLSGSNGAGGLVGKNEGAIYDSYSRASISGWSNVGGLVGLNTGTVTTSYAASDITPSVFNNYMEFDSAKGGYIKIPHKLQYQINNFTIEAWFQWDLLTNRSSDVHQNVNFIIGKGVEQFEIHTEGNSGPRGIRFIPVQQGADGGSSLDSWIDARDVMQEGWFHVAVVYVYEDKTEDNITAQIYINGKAQDLYQGNGGWDATTGFSVTETEGKETKLTRDQNPLASNINDIFIGARTGPGSYFEGKIADVRFWSEARSQAQISENMHRQQVGTELGLIGYWKLDDVEKHTNGDDTYKRVKDYSGTDNYGILMSQGNFDTIVENGELLSPDDESYAVKKGTLTSQNMGGLIGSNSGEVTNSYYDSTVSGQLDDTGKGVPKSTTEMKQSGTFNTWNLTTIWGMNSTNNGYPYLLSTSKNITSFSFGALDPVVTGSVNEGAKTIALTVPYGTIVTTLVPTILHTGASISPASGVPQDFTSPVTYTVTAADTSEQEYVVTVTVTYTVSFVSNGGSAVADIPGVRYDATIATPAAPTKTGYTFGGWYKEAGLTNLWNFDTDKVTGATTLYAKWTANTNTAYKVEHYQQNIDGSSYTLQDTDNLTGTTATTATAEAKSYTGFSENTTHGSRVASGTIAADGTLVLKLYYDRTTYTVSFNSNDGTTVDAITGVRYDATIATPAAPTKTGYTFGGWYKEAGLTNLWNFDTDKLTGATTLYAKWTANTNTAYKVEHYQQNIDGSSYTLQETDNLSGTTATTATAEAKSYTGFSENTTHVSRVASGTIVADGSLVLKLYYDRITYTVSFENNGGTTVDAITGVHYDATIATPPAPTKTGYTFGGWYKEAGLTNLWNFDTDKLTGATTLYAKWTANTNTAYKVEHCRQNIDGSSYTLQETDNLSGTTATTATAEAKSYTGFSENTTHGSRVASGTIAADGSLVLKLYYDRITYTVSFENNGGTTVDAITGVHYDATIAAPAAPTKTGYTFGGWYKDAGLTNLWNFGTDKVIGTTILYAKWTANTNTAYKVEHYQQNIDGSNYTLQDTDNLTGTTATTATAEAKSYTGFSENTTHGSRVASGTIAADGSLVLKLYYDRITYTVSFENNGGTTVDAITGVRYDATIATPPAPTKTGYTFGGWYKEAGLTNQWNFDTDKVTSATTLYSKWVAVSTDGETEVEIFNNGKIETVATSNTITVGGKTVTTYTVDDEKVEEKLQQGGNNAVVTIPAMNNADVVVGQLNGQTVKNMETKEAVLEIKTGNVTYTVPASQINIDNVSAQLGEQVELKDIIVSVKISAPSMDTTKIVEDTANKNNYQIVVKPVEFEITCTSGDKTVEVSKFNGYVERIVAIPDGIDPSKITTGVILNSDGTFSHVPTTIIVIDGKYYAKINSLTNSVYSVIWNPITVASVENHWSKESVNNLAARLIIKNPESFAADGEITRGDYAEYITKAIGIYRTKGARNYQFADVAVTDELADAITIAVEYGIIKGYPDGTFKPLAKISREEAMAMYARAMDILELTEIDNNRIAAYKDAAEVADWAYAAVKKTVSAGVFNGRTEDSIVPKGTLTYAEAATAIRNLLLKAELIDK